jgi:pantoate--beta-alanine ligase
VATVVLKLFNTVQPDVAVFGQKDAQQARIIQQLVDDLNVPVKVVVAPTVREPDGLALSSRNRYLSPEHRAQAVVLSRALNRIQEAVRQGERDVARLEAVLTEVIATAPDARIDYAQIVDAVTLRPIEQVERAALAAVAVFFGTTRLIDNMILTP